MIKALILDVDGVIVGDQPGWNFPLPHAEVIQKFREVHAKGVPIILCTAKFGFAIQGIIKQAGLNNPHITDGGALIIDPIDHVIVKKHIIAPEVVQECLALCLEKEIFTEAYTPDDCFQQQSQVIDFPELAQKRIEILQKEPVVVESLSQAVKDQDIIKIIAFAKVVEKAKVGELITHFDNRISHIWSQHPYLQPLHPIVITAAGISKALAAKEAIESLKLTFDEVLGVGDTASDWKFMEFCKYAATLANGDDQIKELVQTKGDGNYFIAPHVNDNGMIDILNHFSLL